MSESKRASRPPYPPEVRERAVRMVFEHQGEYPSPSQPASPKRRRCSPTSPMRSP
jgi:hypothetical protein